MSDTRSHSSDVAFTPAVKAIQARKGSREAYAQVEACGGWHRMLNDTLAEWCADNSDRFSFVASAPLVDAGMAASELDRAAGLGAVAVMVSSGSVRNDLPPSYG